MFHPQDEYTFHHINYSFHLLWINIFCFTFPTAYFLFCLIGTGDSNFPLSVSFWLLEIYFLVKIFALICFAYFSFPVSSAFSYYNPILFPHRSQIVSFFVHVLCLPIIFSLLQKLLYLKDFFCSKYLHLFYSSCRVYYLTTQPNWVQTILPFQILAQNLRCPQHRNICIFEITLKSFPRSPMCHHSHADQACSTATPSHAEEQNAESVGLANKNNARESRRASKGDIWSEPCPLLLLLSPAPRKEGLSSLGKTWRRRACSAMSHLSLEWGKGTRQS